MISEDLTPVLDQDENPLLKFYTPKAMKIRYLLAPSLSGWLWREFLLVFGQIFVVTVDDRDWVRLPGYLGILYPIVRPLRLSLRLLGRMSVGAKTA